MPTDRADAESVACALPAVGSVECPVVPLTIERLILDFHSVIYSYAYRLTGNPHDAEDLTQQTFLVAQRKLSQVREPAKIFGWLSAVLRSCYFKMRRKSIPLNAASLELEVDEIPEIVADDVIDRDQLQRALNQLPEEYKLVVLAFYFEECTYQEIAERLNIPLGTVMSRLSRAKSRIRAVLIKNDANFLQKPAAPPSNPVRYAASTSVVSGR